MSKQLIRLLIASAIATLLPLPVNAIDVVIAMTTKEFFVLNTIFSPIFDAIFAVITYILANNLVKLLSKKDKNLKKAHRGMKRGKDFMLTVASATPFPFTVMIYALGIVGYGRSLLRFFVIVLIGRTFKYIVLGGAIYFGIEIIKLTITEWILLGGIVLNTLLLIYFYKPIHIEEFDYEI